MIIYVRRRPFSLNAKVKVNIYIYIYIYILINHVFIIIHLTIHLLF